MNKVIKVNNVGKVFTKYTREIDRVLSWFGFPINPSEVRNILDGVSFDVNFGEALAIIGKNGAGKSTLLKIITGTLKPSSGEIKIHGRISAILELGMGFHPDLTGRQNVYKTGGLMGFSRRELDSVIEEIKAFSEIGEYFEEPVRTYSSGMQVRVAFGLATAFRPDVLIIDEALSVGDVYFQQKSFKKIKTFQKEGTTLILVSHDKDAVQNICDKAILLQGGRVVKISDPETIFDYYHASIGANQENEIVQSRNADGRVVTKSGSGDATVKNTSILNSKDEMVSSINVGDKVRFVFDVDIKRDLEELTFGFSVKDRLGRVLYGTNSMLMNQTLYNLSKGKAVRFTFEFVNHFGVGNYTIQTSLDKSGNHTEHSYEWVDNAISFDVLNPKQHVFVGSTWVNSNLTVDCENDEDD
ncbi:TPA: ABC transporter ATP-binding protein [Vibrio cholerae]|uniref:ABC transporter ATP-binding protein n=1 Tax=Vibrio cholerae TaxID=666 RepID=UPI000615B7E2|nr:ABC transporter ATP-binding protein [Vibrio cholerae]AKB03494.1 ABC transporter family protein [Vibrio cholerae]EGQ7644551.1 ABC transporter ATP-binding protein [Vibrio cholerae]EGR2418600.1 ABC transporter ATP-binding protein [Vibrio cholerae]EJL6275235.1 ABC transporter ATP-binding protein [Vibrio cholerae]EKF9247769.1 ABC transporter ATP-binding protein [Vibrio cholerae]